MLHWFTGVNRAPGRRSRGHIDARRGTDGTTHSEGWGCQRQRGQGDDLMPLRVINATPAVIRFRSSDCYLRLMLMLWRVANMGLPAKTAEMQMSICLTAYKGGFVVQCWTGGTPVRGQNSNISYDVPKPVIGYLTGYQLTNHWCTSLLWPPYVADADIIFLPCGFFFLFFFPRLISAVGYWMSTIPSHVVWC